MSGRDESKPGGAADGWIDLASERLDGCVLWANDDFFAGKENLVRAAKAVWDPDRYTDRGKWMDGWESRRRREPGHDECIVQLGVPGIVRELVVDTAHFEGNYPESCRVEACWAPTDSAVEELLAEECEWIEILAQSALEGDRRNRFAVDDARLFSHVRLHIYPDGGVARLRVLGEAAGELPAGSFDLAALVHGGSIVAASDRFFSAPEQLLLPGSPTGMHDGWQTRRRRGPGNDWVVVHLAAPGRLERVVVDTSYFKGNAPGWFSLEGLAPGVELPTAEAVNVAPAADGSAWRVLMPKTELQPDREHVFGLERVATVETVRLQIYPDGGVARLRLFGQVEDDLRRNRAVAVLDHLPADEARRRLLPCCGSDRWVDELLAARPHGTAEKLVAAAETVWNRLDEADWQQAFAAHPRLGEQRAARATGERATDWSRREQVGIDDAEEGVRLRLTHANRRYEERFDHLFLVCATGRSAEEMLAMLEERLSNAPADEFRVAASEQAKITRLRLLKLLDD